MKRFLIILAVLPIILAGCERAPYADAHISPNPAFVGEDIHFTNYSTNTEYVEWDMGDGATSSAFNVTHYFLDPGLYNVQLRAFGIHGGVSNVSFVVDVIGSELEIEVRELYDEYLIEGASVILYPTYDDWLNFSNQVGDEQFTNGYGKCYFSNLSYQRYYVDVWATNYDNWSLGETDPGTWIETQMLPGGWDHTFVAYVNYYETVKKNAPTSRPATRELRTPVKPGAELPLRENKYSFEKEKR